MDARKPFVVAAALAALVAAEITTRPARADYQHNGFVVGTTAALYVWNVLGEAYRRVPGSTHWDRVPEIDLPVPAGDVKILSGNAGAEVILVTITEDVWWTTGAPPWVRMDPVPGGPVSVARKSFGRVKAASR